MESAPYNQDLKKQLTNVPPATGVYIFKDATDQIVYIGKALSLRQRMRSYFNDNAWRERPKLAVMMPKVKSFEWILTNSGKEALLLEANLVRQHMPRYNVTLKDDKRYPWLAITYDTPFPRLIMIRDPARFRKSNPKAKIFGPYVAAGAMWDTVRVLRKVFPLRQRKTPLFKDRPCMNFHLGLCLGPCQNLVDAETYDKIVKQVELFLTGRQNEVVSQIKKEMDLYSQALNYELAAKARDKLNALRTMIEKQQVFFASDKVSQDALGAAYNNKLIAICRMQIREGKLISSEVITLPLSNKTSGIEAWQSFIDQYYTNCNDLSVPKEILLEHEIEDSQALSELLSERTNFSVNITLPKRGEKQKLIDLARKNAQAFLDQEMRKIDPENNIDPGQLNVLEELKKELDLKTLPHRIECFDISNIQGTDNVASMVVFENALPKKSDYRLFKIRSIEGEANDFASMKEVTTRRYKKLISENKALPDLIIIDGGKGQLNAALETLAELKINDQPIIGLAKKQEEIYFPNKTRPLLLSRQSKALHLLQAIRNEAHRFAITFHRKKRAKRVLKSSFDDLPGIGKARRSALLQYFGSFEDFSNSPAEEIAKVKGFSIKSAQNLLSAIKTKNDTQSPTDNTDQL